MTPEPEIRHQQMSHPFLPQLLPSQWLQLLLSQLQGRRPHREPVPELPEPEMPSRPLQKEQRAHKQLAPRKEGKLRGVEVAALTEPSLAQLLSGQLQPPPGFERIHPPRQAPLRQPKQLETPL